MGGSVEVIKFHLHWGLLCSLKSDCVGREVNMPPTFSSTGKGSQPLPCVQEALHRKARVISAPSA